MLGVGTLSVTNLAEGGTPNCSDVGRERSGPALPSLKDLELRNAPYSAPFAEPAAQSHRSYQVSV